MWTATMALNGIIAVGVPQDWATHTLGHEITAKCGLDHGHTLAIVLPSLLKVKAKNKSEKLLQYASRIWGIDSASRIWGIDHKRNVYKKQLTKLEISLNRLV